MDNNNMFDFLLLDKLLSIYRSSRSDKMGFFESLKTKYYMQASINQKPEILKTFNHFEPLIQLILQIRNS